MGEKKQMINNTIKILIFILLVTCSVVVIFLTLFEKKEREFYTPASKEARKNPFLAAERFLHESGIEATTINKKDILVNLPPTTDLIFINKLGGNLPEEREDNLLNWIDRGGTLIITHDKKWDDITLKSGNNFLDKLGIRLHDYYELRNKEQEESEDSDTNETYDNDTDNEDFSFSDYKNTEKEDVFVEFLDEDTAEVEFTASDILEDTAVNAADIYSGNNGNHIIIRKTGNGKLVVLSDNVFLRNTKIGKKDHAYLWAQLTKGRKKVWLLFNSRMPSFLSILREKAPYFLISLLLFTIASIVWLNMKIGPSFKIKDTSSRNIVENLQASGHFIKNHDRENSQIQELRASIGKNLITKHLYLERKTLKQRFELIAKWTNLPFESVNSAFTSEVKTSDDFIKVTKLLKKINVDLLVNNKKTETS